MLKKRVAEILDASDRPTAASKIVNWSLFGLISANVLAMVLESVESIHNEAPAAFLWFERVSLALFALEYGLRLWSCTELPRYRSPLTGRLRYALTPLAIIDLVTISPLLVPALGMDLRSARAVRLFRIFRVAKLARYSRSLRLIGRVFRARRSELLTVFFFLATLMLLSSTLMYFVEHDSQPEVFSSIPATAWWSVATFTTVGYGDVYPVTVAGKILAGAFCILGIGAFALPTSILGAAFVKELGTESAKCPHCGRAPGAEHRDADS
jgi:voltage-gated potassium channel